jgi:hypothetical protein
MLHVKARGSPGSWPSSARHPPLSALQHGDEHAALAAPHILLYNGSCAALAGCLTRAQPLPLLNMTPLSTGSH